VITLYNYFRSSAAFRVRAALNLKGLAYERVAVSLVAGEQQAAQYKTLNPQGLVPAMVLDGSQVEQQVLVQSMAIIEYLDEIHPQPPLMPADALGRYRVRALSQAIACDLHPINNLRILKYLKQPLGHNQEEIDTWYRHWCQVGLGAFEAMLNDGGAGVYCHGDEVSMADICLVPQVFNAVRFQVEMSQYPLAHGIFERLMKLPAFDAAQPSRQPDAPAA
jgi:maleylacetoacetate isomerase